MRFPNYGAALVAGQIADLDVEYFDCGSENDLVRAAERHADLYLIGGSPFYSDLAFEGPPTIVASQFLRRATPNVMQILFGNLSTLQPSYFAETQADAVFRGELEGVVRDLALGNPIIESAAALTMLRKYAPGRASAAQIHQVADLGTLQWPDHSVLTTSATSTKPHRSLPDNYTQILFSRGCRFKCSFCTSPALFGETMRFRDPADLIAEILHVKTQFGVEQLVFWDDLLLPQHPSFAPALEAMEGIGLGWSCNTRPDCLNERSISKMAAAGCTSVLFGAEADSPELLDKFAHRKERFPDLLRTRVSQLSAAGIKPVISFIIGYPTDDVAAIRRRGEFAARFCDEGAAVNVKVLVPIPGTSLYQSAVATGVTAPCEAWGGSYATPPYGYPTLCEGLDREQLRKIQLELEADLNTPRFGAA